MITTDEAIFLTDHYDGMDPDRQAKAKEKLSTYKAARLASNQPLWQPTIGEQRDKTERVESYFDDIENLTSSLSADKAEGMKTFLEGSADPEREKLQMANVSYLAREYGMSDQKANEAYALLKRDYGEKVFDRGDLTDEAFYTRVKTKVGEKRIGRQWTMDFLTNAQDTAIKGDKTWQQAYRETFVKLSEQDGFDPKLNDFYYKAFKDTFEEVDSQFAPHRENAQEVFDFLASSTGIEGVESDLELEEVLEKLDTSTEEDRQALYFLLATKSEEIGLDKGFWHQTVESIGRGVVDIAGGHARNITETTLMSSRSQALSGRDMWIPLERRGFEKDVDEATWLLANWRPTPSDGITIPGTGRDFREITDSEREQINQEAQKFQKRKDIQREFKKVAEGVIDPIKGNNFVTDKIWYPFTRNAAFTAQAFVGPMAMPLLVSSTTDMRFGEIMDRNPGIDRGDAFGMAMVSGVVEAPIEMLSAKLILGKAPSFSRLISRAPGSGMSTLARQILAVGAIQAVEQNFQEAAQDVTPLVVQQVSSALNDDIPSVDWDKELGEFAHTRIDTFWATLPMVLIGTGAATYRDFESGKKYMDDATSLRVMGLQDEAIRKILAESDFSKREVLYQEAYDERDQAESASNIEKLEAQKLEAEYYNESDQTPLIGQQGDKFFVEDPSGELIGEADSFETAREMALDWQEIERSKTDSATVEMVDYIEEIQESGSSIELIEESKTLQDEIDEGNISEAEAFEAIRVAGMNLGMDLSNATPSQMQVFGKNMSDFKDNVFRDVSKIFKGASPLDVMEEHSEGYIKRSVAEGNLAWADVEAWKKEYEDQTGNVTHGASERELTEWFSDRTNDYLLGRSRELTKADKIPSALRGWMERSLEYVRAVMKRAAQMMKLRREGKLNVGFERELKRAIGADEAFREQQFKDEELAEIERDLGIGEKGQRLSERVKALGGLLAESKEAVLTGELRKIKETVKNKGEELRLFRKDAKPLDDLRGALVEEGFRFDTITEMIDALEEDLSGEGVFAEFAEEELGDSQTFSIAPIPLREPGLFAWERMNELTNEQFDEAMNEDDRKDNAHKAAVEKWVEGTPKAFSFHWVEPDKTERMALVSPDPTGGYRHTLFDKGIFEPKSDWLPFSHSTHKSKQAAVADLLKENSVPLERATLLDPNTVSTASFSMAPVNKPAFKKWFKDSKVVDSQGNPKVMHHGTGATGSALDDFAFDHSRIGQQGRGEGAGFYFTSDRSIAEGYGDKGSVLDVYLSIQKPMPFDQKGFSVPVMKKIIKKAVELEAKKDEAEISDGFLANIGDVGFDGLESVLRSAAEMMALEESALDQLGGIVGSGMAVDILNKALFEVTGFDGTIATGFGNEGVAGGTIYVAHFPEQIKTVHNETFDVEDARISFAMAEPTKRVIQKERERKITERISTAEHKGKTFDKKVRDAAEAKMYEVMPNSRTVDEAKAILDKGVEDATLQFFNDRSGLHLAVRNALGMGLAQIYNDSKEFDTASKIIDRLAELGTEQGQGIQVFSMLGAVLDTPEAAQGYYARQKQSAGKSVLNRPEVEKSIATIKDVLSEANDLFNGWIKDIIGKPKRAKKTTVTKEDLPEITFKLSPNLIPLLPQATEYMEAKGAEALDELLISKYGDKIREHLADIKIEAVKTIINRQATTAKKTAKKRAAKKVAKKRAKPGEKPSVEEVAEEVEETEDAPAGKTVTKTELRKKAKKVVKERLKKRFAEKLKERSITDPKILGAAFEKLIDKFDEGEITQKEIEQVVLEKFKFPTASGDVNAKLAEMAKKIGRAPVNSVTRRNLTVELMDFVHDELGNIDAVDIAWSLWYANILSGYNTHIRNLGDTGLQVLADTTFDALSLSPSKTIQNLQISLSGIIDGARTGFKEAKRHATTGEELLGKDTVTKFGARGVLERVTLPGGKFNPFNYAKFVGRLLVAEDGFWFHTAQEIKSRQVALEMVQNQGGKGDVWKRVETLLNQSDEQISDFDLRAAMEWQKMLPGDTKDSRQEWIDRRVQELQQQNRDADLIERAAEFAARSTYNYKPEGLIGVAAEFIGIGLHGVHESQLLDSRGIAGKAVKAVSGAGKVILPFVRIVANVLNKSLDYSPVGLVRSYFDVTIQRDIGKTVAVAKTADNRARELKKGLFGTMVIAALLMREPDEEDFFQIHGAGPDAFDKQNQLKETGWLPFSMKIGGKYISYKNTPLVFAFAWVAKIQDAKRYNPDLLASQDFQARMAYALTGGAKVMLDQSFLTSISDVFEIMGRSERAASRGMERFLRRTFSPTVMVPFSNLFKQLSRDLDNKLRDREGILAEMQSVVPWIASFEKPRLNMLGEPVETRPVGWLWSEDAEGDDVRLWRVMADKNAFLGGIYQFKLRLEHEDWYDFQEARGKAAKKMMLKLLPRLEGATEEQAQDLMRRISARATVIAKREIDFESKDKKEK